MEKDIINEIPDELDLKNKIKSSEQLSDEQFKQVALNRIKKETADNYDGPFEVIDLPSKGLVYSKDNPLSKGSVRMKYMTAKEEDILSTPGLIKKNTVIDELLKAMILDPINYNDLIIGDKNWLMVAARILGYGAEYKVMVTDPFSEDEEKVETSIDLSELEFNEFDESLLNNENLFDFELPKSKHKIKFRLMTVGLEARIKSLMAKNKFSNKGVSNELSTRIKHMIVEFEGESNFGEISKRVDDMLAMDSKALRNHINKIQPDVKFEFEFISPTMGESIMMKVPFETDFFWPGS